jgi:hypothetical protein
VFLGTPHHGSGLAQWAERLAKTIGVLKQTNPHILGVLESDSEVLARVQDGFHTMVRSRNLERLHPIEITCFYEELPLVGVGIVRRTLSLFFTVLILAPRSSLLIQLSYQVIFR